MTLHHECEYMGCMALPQCQRECVKLDEHESSAPLPAHIRQALDEMHKARQRSFWKLEATIPPYLLKATTLRGNCYPSDTESQAAA